jgi:hypothetical protein
MNFSSSFRLGFFFFFMIGWLVGAKAQPMLPDMQTLTQKGINILSWVNQYDGLKSIAVERSSDSIYNFTTIGYVKNLKKGPQAFIDGHPSPGVNWYRLNIVFSSDLNWYSNRAKIYVDSAQLLQQRVLPPNDSLQKMASSMTLNAGAGDPSEINAYTYIRSQYVFTNPFTGHVNVELPENADKKATYSLRFFNGKNTEVLHVPKISERIIVIDKRNFQKKGLYKFELRKNKELLETGYITIY